MQTDPQHRTLSRIPFRQRSHLLLGPRITNAPPEQKRILLRPPSVHLLPANHFRISFRNLSLISASRKPSFIIRCWLLIYSLSLSLSRLALSVSHSPCNICSKHWFIMHHCTHPGVCSSDQTAYFSPRQETPLKAETCKDSVGRILHPSPQPPVASGHLSFFEVSF
jgi:hypothetical protein